MNQANTIDSRQQLDELLAQQETAILYFSTEQCTVCQSVFPKLMEVVEEYHFPVYKIPADEVKDIAGQHLVFTVPTILVVQEGKELLRESRFIDFENIDRILSLLQE